MKKKVSLFLTALCCAVGAVSASEVDSVQVAEVHGNVAARKQRTDNDEYTRFRVGGYGEAVASFKDYGINRYYGNPNGNTRDHRNTISIPRFVLAMDYKFTPKWILIAVGLIGCGSSVFHPESSRVAQLASGGRKGLAQSIFQVGGNAGSAMGPLLAALIVIPFGQSSIGWFALTALLAIFILVRIGDWYKRRLAIAVRRPDAAETAFAHSLPRRKIHTALVILGILVFSKYFYIASMTSYFTFFLMDKFAVSVQGAQYCLFAFLAASAAGTFIGGPLGDRIGRKYVIWGSILGAAPFTLLLPYVGLAATVVLSVVIGLVISSAFSAILVYATDLMPGKVGMIAGVFFGLMFGLGGLGSAFFGWLADRTSIEFIFQVSTLLPLLGVITGFLPNIESKSGK